MGNWKLVVPEATTNLIDNPSFETGTTGWAASGTNTIAQSADEQKFGVYSLECTYQNNTTLASYSITINEAQHTFTCWVYLPSNWDGGAVNLDIANFASATTDTASNTVSTTGEWTRLEMKFTPAAGDLTGDVIVETASAPTAGRDIHIDGAQLEEADHSTTYCDGAQEDCSWDGAEHGSTSTRVAYGIGGRIRDVDTDLDFKFEIMQGLGAPPVNLHFDAQPQLHRDTLKGLRYNQRTMQFRSTIIGTSLSNLHDTRQAILKAFDPLTGRVNDAPRLRRLRYTGASTDKEIDVVYDDGLGFSKQEGFSEEAQPRLIAPDPNFYQVGESAATLDVTDSITIRAVAGRIDGRWDDLGPPHSSGTYNDVRAIVADEENGYIYFGGDFVNFNNVANADGIVRYSVDDGTWAALGTGTSGAGNDTVYDMALAANGDLYVTGDFLNMGGVAAADYVARWDGSSWNALSTGLNALGRAIIVAQNGWVWIGGDFTQAAGNAMNYITYWDGSSFNTVGSGPGLSDDVHALEQFPSGLIGVGGKFRAQNGGTNGDLERYAAVEDTEDTPTFTGNIGSGTGFNNTVEVIKTVASGRIWIGGSFTQDSDGNTLRRIAEHTGSGQPTEIGGGVSGGVNAIYPAPDGTVWLGGVITTVDQSKGLFSTLNGLVKRVGDVWAPPRIGLNAGGATNTVHAIAGYGDDVYIGHDYSGSTDIAGSTDITYTGTAPAYPVITIGRSGGTNAYLYEIVNRANGAVLSFNSYDIKDGETITIDTRPGKRSIRNNKGTSLLKEVIGVSDIGSFYLSQSNSGNRTNTIEVVVIDVGSPTMTATIRYRVAYRGAD